MAFTTCNLEVESIRGNSWMESLTETGNALTRVVECATRVSGKAACVTVRASRFTEPASVSTECSGEVVDMALGRFIIQMDRVLKAGGMAQGSMVSASK